MLQKLNHINPINTSPKIYKILLILVYLYLCILSVRNNFAQSINSNLNWTQFIEKDVFGQKQQLLPNEYYLLHANIDVRFSKERQNLFQVIRVLDAQNYIIKLNNSSALSPEKILEVGSLYLANTLWKLNERLLKHYLDSIALDARREVVIKSTIPYFSNTGNRLPLQSNYYKTTVAFSEILKLIKMPHIIYVGLEDFNVHKDATVLDLNLHPNRVNAVHNYFPEFRGQTELVSIQEPFYDTEDIDLFGRFVDLPFNSTFSDNHATEMATIIAGKGNSFITGHGVATEVHHTSADNTLIVPQEQSYYTDNNIQVQNHSYGTSIETFYGSMAAAYDEQVAQNPFVLHVQSSGNSGQETSQNGNYNGIVGASNLTGNFKQAKNVITIGSVDTTAQHAIYSSVGPAHDGRIKPELTAYSVGGTSNAAALVSGTAVLLQQFYKSRYNKPMEAALLKAILINSADEAGAPGIDYRTGYGQLNALGAMEAVQSGNFFSDTLLMGEQRTFDVNIPENAINFKATLVWTDRPANPNDAIALVNDLDMLAEDALGQTFYPAILNHNPDETLLSQSATTGQDHLNNIEQINIPAPSQGVIKLTVSPFSLASEEQAFHIVYQYDLKDNFRWTSPTTIDNIPYNGETISHLRWESTFSNQQGVLAYRLLAQPNDWITVENAVNLKEEQKRWNNPEVNGLAQLKMNIGNETFISDTFTISTPLKMNINFNCADSIMLSWNSLSNAEQYQLSNLEGSKMQLFAETADTSIIIHKNKFSSDYFNIAAIVNLKKLISSFTIDYTLQGDFCFLKSYFTYVKQDSGVFIELSLGTTQFIRKVVLQRKVGEKWSDYLTQIPTTTQFRFNDESPNNGLNFYRIKVEFTNDTALQSEELTAYFVKNKPFIVYPNPISTEEDLKVFGREVNSIHTFELINANGQKVLAYLFDDDRAYVELPSTLKEGLYIYHIFTKNGSVFAGKLLIKN